MAPQLATVDVVLNAFYGPNAQPYHQMPPKLKTKGLLIPEDKASQYHLVSAKQQYNKTISVVK